MLDKTGLTKEQKEVVSQIESKLSMIARQGRAFGIHLTLATQRPDAHILAGQIPKYAQGRFILKDGTVFQGFLFDENSAF